MITSAFSKQDSNAAIATATSALTRPTPNLETNNGLHMQKQTNKQVTNKQNKRINKQAN